MKNRNLTLKTLMYFSVFIAVILLALWAIQIQFLQVFYERNVIEKIDTVAEDIKANKNNLDVLLQEYAYSNDMCIEYYHDTVEIDYNLKKNSCILRDYSYEIAKYKAELINNQKDYMILYAKKTNIKSILYAVNLGNSNYVFLNATLEDMNSATALLKKQLIYLILILILASCIMAIFVSRRLNRPILKIISTAREMGKGNFNVKFEKSNVEELDELCDVLTVAASEMNKTEELKRDLLANVSHDLKTPLTMIKAYAEKVKDITYKDPEKREKDLNVIIEETDRLNNLVNDLLDLSKMQAGESELNIEEYDIVKNINEILKRYDIVVEKEGYKFELDMPKSAKVKADKAKIEQVIYNLINNAIEHTGEDLRVIITVKKQLDSVMISIKDTGAGLTEEEKQLVWNRYYKKEKKHKRNVIGSGIGLSIVKGILESHKCEYGIDSKVGQYTSFYFKLKK